METKHRLLKCINEVFDPPDGNETNMHPSEGIDDETYTIALVCFALASLSSTVHILLILCIHRVRKLYGPWILLGLLCYLISKVSTLISCCLQWYSWHHWLIANLADFSAIATLATNLMSSVGVCRQLWLGAMWTPSGSVKAVTDNRRYQLRCVTIYWRGNVVYVTSALCFVAIYPTLVLLGGVYYPENSSWNATTRLDAFNFSCNIIPNPGRFHVLFPCIFLLIAAQLVCVTVCARLRFKASENLSMLEQLDYLTSRFWVNTKFSITHFITWTTAFIAVYWHSITVWHVFTIFCSLQAIYMTVHCIFSRPVLDILYRRREGQFEVDMRHMTMLTGMTSQLVYPITEAKLFPSDRESRGKRVLFNNEDPSLFDGRDNVDEDC